MPNLMKPPMRAGNTKSENFAAKAAKHAKKTRN